MDRAIVTMFLKGQNEALSEMVMDVTILAVPDST